MGNWETEGSDDPLTQIRSKKARRAVPPESWKRDGGVASPGARYAWSIRSSIRRMTSRPAWGSLVPGPKMAAAPAARSMS